MPGANQKHHQIERPLVTQAELQSKNKSISLSDSKLLRQENKLMMK